MIRNVDFAGQVISFDGLMFNNASPTNMDAMLEYKDKGFIFVEAKRNNAPVPVGQEIAFKRLVNALNKPAVCFFTTWTLLDSNEQICLAESRVVQYYFECRTHITDMTVSLREYMGRFINFLDTGELFE